MRTVRTTSVNRWLLGVTVLAFGLRVYRLAGQSIWYDEGLSVYYARRPLPELLALVSGSDHPPLYFLLLHFWLRVAAFGRPAVEFLVRYPSVVFGVLLVPLVYAFGRRLVSARAGLLAALLVATSPFHVWYSQEARMYTLVVFLTLLASYALWSNLQAFGRLRAAAQDRPHTRPPNEFGVCYRKRVETRFNVFGVSDHEFIHGKRVWGLYALTVALALYAHFYAGFILLAHAAFVTWWAWRRGWWRMWVIWAGASALAVLVFLPWGGLVAGQLKANDTYWRGTLDLGRTITQTAQAFAMGETVGGPISLVVTCAYLLLVTIVLLDAVRRPKSEAGRHGTPDAVTFLSACVVIPVIALLAISYNRPKFAPRYLLTVTPALALLAAQGAVALGRRERDVRLPWLRYLVTTALIGVIISGSGVSLWRHYTDETHFKADWRAAARYIGQHATARDAVVIVAGHAMPAFDFYSHGLATHSSKRYVARPCDNARQLAVYPLPPRLLPTVSDPVETGEVTATLNRLVREGHDRVWLILWQEHLADPRRLTLNQLFEHGRRLGVDQGFHDLGVLLFELPPGTVFRPPHPEHELDVVFGRRLRLDGYDLSSTSVAAGGTLVLRLYWRAVAPMSQDYTAFTQLLSAEDEIVGQHDRRLGGDLYPTSRWPVGEPVRETYELTVHPGTPPGLYRLIAGAYLPPTGPRLLIQGDNMAGNHVVIGEIEVQHGSLHRGSRNMG